MKTALIDADSIIHIVSYHNALPEHMVAMAKEMNPTPEKETFLMLFPPKVETPEDIDILMELYKTKDTAAIEAHVGQFINDILNAVGATHYLGFVGDRKGSDTFRHKLAVTKPYKGQRKSSPHWVKYWKPIIIEYMVREWGFIELSNIEADDACAICQTHLPDTIICSPDKDLKQVPGNHYDYKKVEFTTISEVEAAQRLYIQILTGDSTDNISGCPGVGEKSPYVDAIKLCEREGEMSGIALDAYTKKKCIDIYQEQFVLIYMLRDLTEEALADLKKVPTPIERKPFGIITEITAEEVVTPIINFTFNQ